MADALYLAALPLIKAERQLVGSIMAATGFPEDQLKMVLCFLAAYPLAFILKYLPNSPTLKHIYNLALGLFFCVYSLDRWAWIHSFGSSLVVYLLLVFVSPKVSHKLVFVWTMGYICVSHIYRIYTDYLGWTMDFTGIQMLLTLKLIALGWNYHDGVAPSGKLTAEQQKSAITKLPSLLEFYGWVYFFPTLLAGPAIEISDYLNYINLSMFKSLPENKNSSSVKIPSTIFPTLVVFLRAIVVMGFVILGGIYHPWKLLTPEFTDLPWYHKIYMLHFIVALSRFKYYFAWLMGEGSCVLSGLGFNGVDEKGRLLWDKCTNVLILKVELAQNIRDFSAYWNIGTATWLRKYIYTRVESKNSLVPILATYITSAFWHGFYPGYYLFFLTGGVLTEAARDARRRLRPRFMKADGVTPNVPLKYVYDVAGIIIAELALSYSGAAFLLLSLENAWKVWSSMNFVGHFIIIGFFILIRLVPVPRAPGAAKPKKQE